jgi:hypothetical protein
MIEGFFRNEAEFNKLAEMSDAEPEVITVADTFTRTRSSFAWPRPESEWGISKSRWDEYRMLFSRLGIKHGIDIVENDQSDRSVFIMMRACGHFSGCSDREKGYVHSTTEPRPLVESIDNIPKDGVLEDRVYMHIAPNWYIYENRD